MFAEIWAALKAIPALVATVNEIISLLKGAFGDNPQKFLVDMGEARAQLKAAVTKEDKINAAKTLLNLIDRL